MSLLQIYWLIAIVIPTLISIPEGKNSPKFAQDRSSFHHLTKVHDGVMSNIHILAVKKSQIVGYDYPSLHCHLLNIVRQHWGNWLIETEAINQEKADLAILALKEDYVCSNLLC